jgi:uncharacterized membrane protein
MDEWLATALRVKEALQRGEVAKAEMEIDNLIYYIEQAMDGTDSVMAQLRNAKS